MSFSGQVSSSLATIAAVLVTMGGIAIVETIVPLHVRDGRYRAHLVPNLTLTVLTFATNVVFNSALVLALIRLQAARAGLIPALPLRPVSAGVVAVVGLDFAFYLAHVCMHRFPALWRFHVVHHSDVVVDVTTTIRQHPGESIVRYAFMATAAFALGATPEAFAVYRVWSVMAGLVEHANVRLPVAIDNLLSLLIATPNFHKVHHSRAAEHVDTNYGNCISIFDSLFRTRTSGEQVDEILCGVEGLTDAAWMTGALLGMPWSVRTQSVPARAECNVR